MSLLKILGVLLLTISGWFLYLLIDSAGPVFFMLGSLAIAIFFGLAGIACFKSKNWRDLTDKLNGIEWLTWW